MLFAYKNWKNLQQKNETIQASLLSSIASTFRWRLYFKYYQLKLTAIDVPAEMLLAYKNWKNLQQKIETTEASLLSSTTSIFRWKLLKEYNFPSLLILKHRMHANP